MIDLEMPKGIKYLPRNAAGYPVPWFVAWIDDKPDFRVIGPGRIEAAVRDRLCWLCGRKRPRYQPDAFVIGPMCAINRVSAEPPSHEDCAIYAAKACPFLTNPKKERRTTHLPDAVVDPAGEMISRNPGVALVWSSRTWRPVSAPNGGVLFNVGRPVSVQWLAEGREATRQEVLDSFESGCPILRNAAESDGPDAVAAFDSMRLKALELVPAA